VKLAAKDSSRHSLQLIVVEKRSLVTTLDETCRSAHNADIALISHSFRNFRVEAGLDQANGNSVSNLLFDVRYMDKDRKLKILRACPLVRYRLSSLLQANKALAFLRRAEGLNRAQVVNIGYFMDQNKLIQLIKVGLLLADFPVKYTPLDFALEPDELEEIQKRERLSLVMHKLSDIYKQNLSGLSIDDIERHFDNLK